MKLEMVPVPTAFLNFSIVPIVIVSIKFYQHNGGAIDQLQEPINHKKEKHREYYQFKGIVQKGYITRTPNGIRKLYGRSYQKQPLMGNLYNLQLESYNMCNMPNTI